MQRSIRPIGTARHVCQIFDCFAERRHALSLTEISSTVGLAKSSVYRLLQTLAADGYLRFEPDSRRYDLGPRVGRLTDVYRERNSLAAIARPFLERLRDVTRETAGLQIREGEQRRCIVEVQGPQPIRMMIGENVDYSVKSGSSGDVLRAFSPDWSTQHDRTVLRRIRADGYSVSRGTIIPGSVSVNVPVLDADGNGIATLGVWGPAFRNGDDEVAALVKNVRTTARNLAAALRRAPAD